MTIEANVGLVEGLRFFVSVVCFGCGCVGVRKEQSIKIAFPRCLRTRIDVRV